MSFHFLIIFVRHLSSICLPVSPGSWTWSGMASMHLPNLGLLTRWPDCKNKHTHKHTARRKYGGESSNTSTTSRLLETQEQQQQQQQQLLPSRMRWWECLNHLHQFLKHKRITCYIPLVYQQNNKQIQHFSLLCFVNNVGNAC